MIANLRIPYSKAREDPTVVLSLVPFKHSENATVTSARDDPRA